MKKTRKLFMAVVMVVVSVTMLSTASFAWFAMNRDVKATNMDVEVTTPKDITISAGHVEPAGGSFGFSAIGTNVPKKTLAPVSSVTGLNDSFYFADPKGVTSKEDGTAGGASGFAGNKYIAYTAGDLQKQYKYDDTVVGYIDYLFTIKNETSADVKLETTMKFEHTTAGTNCKDAMRVAVFEGGATTSVAYLGAGKDMPCDAVSGVDATTGFTKNENTRITVKAGKTNQITIRVWIEGGEQCVTTQNLMTAGTFKYTATFTIVEA